MIKNSYILADTHTESLFRVEVIHLDSLIQVTVSPTMYESSLQLYSRKPACAHFIFHIDSIQLKHLRSLALDCVQSYVMTKYDLFTVPFVRVVYTSKQ